jgi:hypothetical protein
MKKKQDVDINEMIICRCRRGVEISDKIISDILLLYLYSIAYYIISYLQSDSFQFDLFRSFDLLLNNNRVHYCYIKLTYGQTL